MPDRQWITGDMAGGYIRSKMRQDSLRLAISTTMAEQGLGGTVEVRELYGSLEAGVLLFDSASQLLGHHSGVDTPEWRSARASLRSELKRICNELTASVEVFALGCCVDWVTCDDCRGEA